MMKAYEKKGCYGRSTRGRTFRKLARTLVGEWLPQALQIRIRHRRLISMILPILKYLGNYIEFRQMSIIKIR